MRIGICVRTWGEKGGIGVYSRSLLDAMIPMEPRHHYCLFFQDGRHLGRFRAHGNVTEIVVRAPDKWSWDQAAVPYRAAREKVDVIFHTKFAVPLFTRRKTVMVLHGSERFVYPQFSTRTDILFFRTIYPFYLRRATAIISVSENARRDIVRFLGIDQEKVRTIHLAPSAAFRRIEDREVLEAVRRKYRLPGRFILNVGLIYPGKNIPNLLRALKQVRRQEDVKLVIAGTGRRMYKREMALIHDLGLDDAVVLPGYVPHEDLVGFYNLAGAVTFPSFYESFPAIPLEANACGCPVVISRSGGSPEAAGDAAKYVDPLDVDGIARAVLDVLTDPALREDLIRKGFENAKRFSWAKTARQTLDLLESLA